MAQLSTSQISEEEVLAILETVPDPEIPVISIVDLGIVRRVEVVEGKIEIDLSPTYSGCPALDVIPILVHEALAKYDILNATIKNVISPPWTTDWISEEGKKKLTAFGITPPTAQTTDPESLIPLDEKIVPCPRCGSKNTTLISRFGSTPCKAAFKCDDCLDPFDYFKCH
ncbi:MAG: phenylacetate-CoA oxygenase subunit PaaJ [Bacteroidetes bacterium]|nr:MAG: phenylacetate-CoA oxygenase subunit PaaJ [Bacteroidota bacterium]